MSRYQPAPSLAPEVLAELLRLADLLPRPDLEMAYFARLYTVPAKLTDGLVCYFDAAAGVGAAGGTRGMYRYDSTTPGWVLLG